MQWSCIKMQMVQWMLTYWVCKKKAAILQTPLSNVLIAVDACIRADSRFAPSQWESALLCNNVSHWLAINLESSLHACRYENWVFSRSRFYWRSRSCSSMIGLSSPLYQLKWSAWPLQMEWNQIGSRPPAATILSPWLVCPKYHYACSHETNWS